jgi:hypothetical protein
VHSLDTTPEDSSLIEKRYTKPAKSVRDAKKNMPRGSDMNPYSASPMKVTYDVTPLALNLRVR